MTTLCLYLGMMQSLRSSSCASEYFKIHHLSRWNKQHCLLILKYVKLYFPFRESQESEVRIKTVFSIITFRATWAKQKLMSLGFSQSAFFIESFCSQSRLKWTVGNNTVHEFDLCSSVNCGLKIKHNDL